MHAYTISRTVPWKRGLQTFPVNFERVDMEAETSSKFNLVVEKLKPENIPGAVIVSQFQMSLESGGWKI